MDFIKSLQSLNKDCNLAILTPICKTGHHHAPYHVKSTKSFEWLSYSNIFIWYKQFFANVQNG